MKGVKINFMDVDLERSFKMIWGKLEKIEGNIHKKERITFEGERIWFDYLA